MQTPYDEEKKNKKKKKGLAGLFHFKSKENDFVEADMEYLPDKMRGEWEDEDYYEDSSYEEADSYEEYTEESYEEDAYEASEEPEPYEEDAYEASEEPYEEDVYEASEEPYEEATYEASEQPYEEAAYEASEQPYEEATYEAVDETFDETTCSINEEQDNCEESKTDAEIDDKRTKTEQQEIVKENIKKKNKEKSFLFVKELLCPVCKQKFQTKMVKGKKLQLVRTSQDLRPIHKGIDTGKYDVIVCPKCGYAALNRYFQVITESQSQLILNTVNRHFHGWEPSGETYSYEDALNAYKLALANAIVKKAKVSEKSYICLKTGWILRGMQEELAITEETRSEAEALKQAELQYLQQAYDGFLNAMENESYPICAMDEATLHYLAAALAMELDNYSEALKLVAYVLHMNNLSDRMWQKAEALQQLILQKKNT